MITVDKGKRAMKFSDFICKQAVRTQVQADDKVAVIRAMARSLLDAKQVNEKDFESIVEAILKREELGSTGIGRGVAVPHTKHPSIDRLLGTVAVSEEGVDFDSLDGEKVHLLFLLVSPPDRPGDHLRALENISRQLRDDTFCRFLKQAKTPEEVWQLLDEADSNQFGN
jgi:mannitol/fructose-specific phosphotransferase system IIA component (Ntr-type)